MATWTSVELYKIDANQSSDQKIYQLATVVRHFDIKLAEALQQHRAGAYLILHNIPTAAIVGVKDLVATESSIYDRDYPSSYHGLPYDPDDSEDDAIRNNCDDDDLKMIEGDW
ncbi:hypothetical protein LTR17_017855 [Elasticomyces elasticus]|nr:hypothetical protein LTR17_017855 [Elasticomyces elasticus]